MVDFSAKCGKTLNGCFDIPVGFSADKVRFAFCKGCTDQKPVGLGFGGNYFHRPGKLSGMNGKIHIKDLPQ
jgi:hypothetical protein